MLLSMIIRSQDGMCKMTDRRFYIVDVFAEKKYTGNQLAVFRHGSGYTDSEMQEIAKESFLASSRATESRTSLGG